MQTFTKMVFGLYLGDFAFLVCLMSPTSIHVKLVRRGDIPNKEIYYIFYAIKGSLEHLPANLEGGLKWGYHLSTDWMHLL